MGKPFNRELLSLESTLEWANTVEVGQLRRFLTQEAGTYVLVGSGGSISASYLLADLLQRLGQTCLVMTPLELYHARQQLTNSHVLLISASGRNKDINFALKVAVAQEPRAIGCLTMSIDSPLTQRARQYSICEVFEYAIPTRKDGFLATNTLLGTWAILLRSADRLTPDTFNTSHPFPDEPFGNWSAAAKQALNTLVVLYGNHGKPVAADLESKCTEAGLVAVQLADFRNFGHGRHHWLAKHTASTALVAIVTPGDEELWAATAALLPASIPRLELRAASITDSYLPLLVQAFQMVSYLGELRGIDPGRPGVPAFGRQLYHLNPASYYPLPKLSRRELAVRRKERNGGSGHRPTEAYQLNLRTAAGQFVSRLAAAKFGSLVIDYDGTLGSKVNKQAPLGAALGQRLVAYLAAGFVLGIATGRGKSAAAILESLVPPVYWPQVLIGYYNGTVVLPLGTPLPANEVTALPPASLRRIADFLTALPAALHFEVRTHQVTVQTTDDAQTAWLLHQLEAYLATQASQEVSLFTSGHCLDIVSATDGSKLNVLAACQRLAQTRQLPADCLCIGDQGRYPGNDFLLLATPYSLSADEVSPDPHSCWNLAGLGQRHAAATQQYLEALTFHPDHFSLTLPL